MSRYMPGDGLFTYPRSEPIYAWWKQRDQPLIADDAQRSGFLDDLEADPCPTIADVHAYAARQGLTLTDTDAHWVLHMFDATRGNLTSRIAFDTAVQRAELARYGVDGVGQLRAARRAEGESWQP